MKKKSIVFILSLFIGIQGFGQAWQWAKDFGGPSTDGGNMTCNDPSGNVFVGGYFGSASINVGSVVINNAGTTGTDVFISKYDASGNALWAQRIGGTAGEFLNDICSDANGRVYVIGAFTSPTLTIPPFSVVNTNTASTTQDIFVACFDAFGTVQWLKKFGGANSDSGEGIIYSNTQSSLYITGGFSSPNMLVGSTTLTNANNTGSSSDIFLAKLSSLGNTTWAIRTGGANSSDSGGDLGLDLSNQYPYVGGTFSPPSASTPTTIIGTTNLTTNGNTDLFVAKYSDTGVFQWVRSGGSTSSSDGFAELNIDANNNCYIAGNYFGAALNIGTTTLANSGGMDGFIAKYNSSGTFQWANKIFTSGNTTNDDTWSIASDASSNIYVGGSYSGTVVANGTLSFTNTVAGSSTDLYVIKFNSSGSILWGLNAQGASYEGVRGMSADAFGNVYVAGVHNVSGPPTFGSTTLTNYGGNDGYVAKLSCRTPTITTTSANYSVCPNSGNTFSITINSPQSDVSYSWSVIGASGVNFSSSTGTTTSVSYTASTSFSIVVTGTNACSTSSVIAGTVFINPLPNVSAIASPTAVCAGNFLTLNGIGASTYSWSNGVINGSAFMPAASFTYTVTGIDVYGCSNTSTINVAIINVPTINITGKNVACLNAPNVLTASGANTYTWLPGSIANSTINVQPLTNSNYTVNATALNGCNNSAVFSVNILTPPTPDICEVTVDSLSNYNEIYWQKTLYPQADSFFVYREVSTNIYVKIGGRSAADSSMFIDTLRSIGPANGNPNLTSYKYKLQLKDSCANYSAKSLWHETIFIQDQQNGNFNWNSYAIESTASPVSNYNLIRRDPSGLETLVGSTTSNVFTDPAYNTFSALGHKWFVDAIGFNCDPTLRLANQNGTLAQKVKTKSNHANDRIGSTKLDNSNSVNGKNIIVYPNPAKDRITIELGFVNENLSIELNNVLGQTIYSINTTESINIINTSNYLSGVYFLNIKLNNKIMAVKKVVLQ